MKKSAWRRLERVANLKATAGEIREAMAAMKRGERPSGKGAEIAREMRVFLLFADGQDKGGVLDDRALEIVDFNPTEDEIEDARAMIAAWHEKYGDKTPRL